MHDFCKILSHLRKGFYIENRCVFKEFGLYSATITMQEVCSIMIKSITIYFLCKLQIDCMSNNSFSINFLRLNFREYEKYVESEAHQEDQGLMFMQSRGDIEKYFLNGLTIINITLVFASSSRRTLRRHCFNVVIQCMCWG